MGFTPCRLFSALLLFAWALAAAPLPAYADAAVLRFAAISLTDAERIAVERSPDVEIARAGVDAAAATLAQARGTNGLSLIAGYTELPQSGGAPNVTWSQRITSYQVQATLGDVNALSPLIAQSAAALRQSVTDELIAERTERLKVVLLYFTAVQARAVLQAKREAILSAEEFESGLREGFGKGKAPYIDLLRAQVALSKARADAAAAQSIEANAIDVFAREIGRQAADLRETRSETMPSLEVVGADQAIARALAQRPELRSAEQSVRAAEAGLAAARRAVIPPITVAGGYAHGVDAGTVIGGPVFSASLQLPLSGIAGARVAAQEAAVRAAVAKEEGVRRALAIEVGAAVRAAGAAIISRNETATSLEAARTFLNLALAQYKTQLTSGLNVKDANDLYQQAVDDDIAAQYAALQAQAALDVELAP